MLDGQLLLDVQLLLHCATGEAVGLAVAVGLGDALGVGLGDLDGVGEGLGDAVAQTQSDSVKQDVFLQFPAVEPLGI